MRRKGMTLWEIARTFNVTAAAVHHMIERAVLDNGRPDIDLERLVALGKLDDQERELWEIIRQPHYRTTIAGALIRGPDGEYVVDKMPVVQALAQLTKILERRAKLLGLDAPARKVTITTDMIDAQIAELEHQLEVRRALIQPEPYPLRAIQGRVEPGGGEPG